MMRKPAVLLILGGTEPEAMRRGAALEPQPGDKRVQSLGLKQPPHNLGQAAVPLDQSGLVYHNLQGNKQTKRWIREIKIRANRQRKGVKERIR